MVNINTPMSKYHEEGDNVVATKTASLNPIKSKFPCNGLVFKKSYSNSTTINHKRKRCTNDSNSQKKTKISGGFKTNNAVSTIVDNSNGMSDESIDILSKMTNYIVSLEQQLKSLKNDKEAIKKKYDELCEKNWRYPIEIKKMKKEHNKKIKMMKVKHAEEMAKKEQEHAEDKKEWNRDRDEIYKFLSKSNKKNWTTSRYETDGEEESD